jgi:cold shock protein
MSDAPLRMAHLRARAITIRFPRTPVTYILSATSPIQRQRRFSLYSLHSSAICGEPVRSGVDRAPHVLVETLAVIGLVPFSETELPDLACGFRWAQVTRTESGPHVRISGTLKFYNASKGFGFIAPDDGSKDVFVHASALERSGIDSLNEGDKVTFVLEDDRKGRGKQAGQIQKS